MEDSGIRGIPNENLAAGVGFIIIPKNVDIETYKKDVYRTGRASIYGGHGHSNFYNILIDREVLQEIEFPDKPDAYGSPVLWINIPKHNEPVVVASFKYDEKGYNFSEFSKKITRTFEQNIVELFLDAKNSKAKISMNSQDSKSEFEITLNSKKGDSKLLVKVDGTTIFHNTDKIVNISEKSIQQAVTNKEGQIVSRLSIDNETKTNTRLRYEDEFKNKITSSKEKINIRADESKKIDFGDGKEPVVLADTLIEKLEKYDKALSKLTVPTAFGPSGTRINDAEFKEIMSGIKEIRSLLTNTD